MKDEPNAPKLVASTLAAKLAILEQQEPEAYARVIRLIDWILANPQLSDAEIANALRAAFGEPTGDPS